MATVDIELYYDLDRRRWTTSAGGLATQPSLFIGQSNTIDFKVRFVQGGVPIELTNPSFIAGVKVTDDPLGDYLLLTTTGTKTGAGATTIYTFTLNIDSVELQAYLVGITPTTNSTAFEVRDTVNNIATLPAITCSILPDYTLTGATPAAGSGTLVVDSGATFTVHKTFAMPTTDGFNNYVLKTNGAGVGSWAADNAGTGTVTNVAVTTANGVSGTVANPTTNAAITLTLGAITPTTGAFSDETDATNSTTAPLKTAGGMAVAKSLYVGQVAYFANNAEFIGDVMANSFRGRTSGSIFLESVNFETLLTLPQVTDSVNYVTIEPSLTTLPVHIYAQGADANIGLHLQAKGAGFVNVQDGTDTTKRLRFSASGNSSAIITTLASSSTTSQTITLPNATGATTLAGLQMTQSFTQVNTFSNATASTSTTSGAVVITGGLGVGGSAYIGGVINIPASTSTAGKITQAGNTLLHTFGTDSIYLGKDAGNTSNTSVASVGVGTRSLYSLSSGRQNLCFGFQSGYYITTGWDNTVFGGYNTGHGIVDGGANTIIGAGANISTDGNYRGAIGAYSSCSADDTIVIGKIAGTYKVNNVAGSRSADAVIIPGTLTVNGGLTIASTKTLKLGNAAVTGLTPGVLAATTNATITITDSAGQVYRIPCII